MEKQARKKLARLMEQYPVTAAIRSKNKWPGGKKGKSIFPETSIHVQRADPDFMHFVGRYHPYGGNSYFVRDDDARGTLYQYVCAIDEADEIVESLSWAQTSPGSMVKELFASTDPAKIEYLLLVSQYNWFEPASEGKEKEGHYFSSKLVGSSLELIVFLKPMSADWLELVETADRLEKERNEAYLHPPKEMPELLGIHEALRQGCRLHAFRSGGGLRVVSLDKEGQSYGYGEHPQVEEALIHANVDYVAGGRPYREVYGGLYPHYLTGSNLATSNLDAWLLAGSTFDAWQEGEEVVFQLTGLKRYEPPDDVFEWMQIWPNRLVVWEDRDHAYIGCGFDDGSFTFKEFLPDEGNESSPHFYGITQTGRGSDFWQAMLAAFDAPEQEIKI